MAAGLSGIAQRSLSAFSRHWRGGKIVPLGVRTKLHCRRSRKCDPATAPRPKATLAYKLFLTAINARPDIGRLSAFERPLFIARTTDLVNARDREPAGALLPLEKDRFQRLQA